MESTRDEPEHQDALTDTPPTVGSFLKILRNVGSTSFATERERMQALLATYALMARLESPWETVVRLCMIQPALGATLKILKDLQVFEKWQAVGGGQMTSSQVAEAIGGTCEAALLERLLRLLASNHLLEEVSVGTFKPKPFGAAITAPIFDGITESFSNLSMPMYSRMPEFFSTTGYKTPQDSRNTVFQYAHGWNGDLWSYYQAHPKEQAEFNLIQQTIASQQPSWTDIFPASNLLDTDPEKPLLVDVGGGTGHDVLKFHNEFPQTGCRLYLEDMELVVASTTLPESIHKVAYDFFTPQPIKGARAYLLHSILHDWSDEPARRILVTQKEAMIPEYSSLLIHDHIVVEGFAHPQATAFDIQMMAMVAGQERSERQWRKLIESAGLKVVKIWNLPSAVHSVIEVKAAS
ncbi:Demethylsterigmatocystin 6-O-methyltransferase 7 [Colletotrichum chlorophyti]|uniref:Demethylsterigmatocystin 6-O-methyltransferase 7 n=1 Tax=Colletotrichum chlorophyti TaxID=708187 RepID=A0A1Q8RXI5_9PEZI|nr:Demethylsterigmatocystin 6-O-methyltransferase 7 [Colletotrichum chlorophyti]